MGQKNKKRQNINTVVGAKTQKRQNTNTVEGAKRQNANTVFGAKMQRRQNTNTDDENADKDQQYCMQKQNQQTFDLKNSYSW